MKKALIIFSSVLGAALLCAGVWFFLTTARQNAAAEAAHDAVLQEYAQLEQNAADTALTVTENGSEIGRYSLEALGVQRGTENAVAAAFSATDLMDAEAFSELPFRNKQNWDALPHRAGSAFLWIWTASTPPLLWPLWTAFRASLRRMLTPILTAPASRFRTPFPVRCSKRT